MRASALNRCRSHVNCIVNELNRGEIEELNRWNLIVHQVEFYDFVATEYQKLRSRAGRVRFYSNFDALIKEVCRGAPIFGWLCTALDKAPISLPYPDEIFLARVLERRARVMCSNIQGDTSSW